MGHVRELPRSAADLPPLPKGEKKSKVLGIKVDQDYEPIWIVLPGRCMFVSSPPTHPPTLFIYPPTSSSIQLLTHPPTHLPQKAENQSSPGCVKRPNTAPSSSLLPMKIEKERLSPGICLISSSLMYLSIG